jgi:hypothetical protein
VHAIDFLASPVLELPKTRDDSDFERYIAQMLEGYLAELNNVRPDDFISQHLRATYGLAEVVCAGLRDSINRFLRGYPFRAYEALTETISNLGAHFDQFFPAKDVAGELKSLYRMCADSSAGVGKGRLFHCPFELRHKVGTQRYSIPGLPCLYFGGSTLVCWREIREPSFGEIHVSRFGVADGVQLNVVNLAYRPTLMAAMLQANLSKANQKGSVADFVISYAACWPLMAVCAIRRLHDGSFAPEYTVPQMLLQWVSDTKKYHGIRFFSTRTEEYFDDPKTGANYVFPARTTPASGVCTELATMFELTEPLRWDDARARPATGVVATPRYKIRGNPIPELERDFGHVESVLESLPLSFV